MQEKYTVAVTYRHTLIETDKTATRINERCIETNKETATDKTATQRDERFIETNKETTK